MATFVLVHGAWTGAFAFRRVRQLLQAQGHEVFTPSLTGIGDRAHLASPIVDLSTHVRDVVNLVLYEDLKDVVLLGFSYGGFVVTGALEHIADRVAHLVYLDAFVPERSGDSVFAQHGRPDRAPAQIGEPWLAPPPQRHFDSAEEGAWIAARRTPQPIATLVEPVYVAQPVEDYPFTRTYIFASAKPSEEMVLTTLEKSAARARSSTAWCYFEIETSHMVASNRPVELTEILLSLLRR
jgi:pimeloyl-ACP methyl ester carboxylesterase